MLSKRRSCANRLHDAAPCGFHLLGYLTGSLGLGEAARHTLRIMNRLKLPVAAKDVSCGNKRSGIVQEVSTLLDPDKNHWPGQINIFHINPMEVEMAIRQYPSIPIKDRLNAIVPFWELPVLTSRWLPCLRAMDCILAPTRFIAEAIRTEFPDKPVIHYPQTLDVTDPADPDRKGFGLPDDAFVLLCAFDVLSDAERKNPWGAIEAFRMAFSNGENARLIIKARNVEMFGIRQRLEDAAAGDPRILIFDDMLPRERLQRLYASCDALVSLHRSEGLGLFIMEMMAQAKPVIVTAWSGNMDFTTRENACLIDYRLVPVSSAHPEYQFGPDMDNVHWADADKVAAADWMKRLAADPELRARIGREARATMIERATKDCSEVFEQLRHHYLQGLKRRRSDHKYFRKIRWRIRCKQLEQCVKKFFRRGRPKV